MRNFVDIEGNVGKDAEMRYTPNGLAVANFSLANTRSTGKGENKKELTSWFSVEGWREIAEDLVSKAKKGQRVSVQGHLEIRKREHQGKTYVDAVIVVSSFDGIKLLGWLNEDGGKDRGAREPHMTDNSDGDGDIPF